MSNSRISDLDELALSVRDQTSRSYILEAIDAYRGGAFRSAIISTWIAVSYDIISKIRDLASQDDRNAIQLTDKLDRAIRNNQIPTLQKIEEDLLESAHKDFELLASHEYEDLIRLKKDRNLCAHPAFVSEEVLFYPTPELVRAHIVHAIVHLLCHAPIQGRSALERVRTDLLRASFPDDLNGISTFLNNKYLNRARASLVQSLVDFIIKIILKGNDPDFNGKEMLLSKVLIVISRRYPQIYEQRMSFKYPELVESLDDHRILSVLLLARSDDRCWTWISNPSRIRIRRILQNLQPKSITEIAAKYKAFDLLSNEDLGPILTNMFFGAEDVAQMNVISNNPQSEFTGKAIELYLSATNYRSAEYLGKAVIIPMLRYFSANDIVTIINGVQNNRQIWEASGTKDILNALFDKSVAHFETTKSAWKEFAENTLKYHEASDYYSYPELRQKLQVRGIDIIVAS